MDIQIIGHNLEVTHGMKEHAEKKLKRISSHGAKVNSTHLSFHIEHIDQIAKLTVLTPGYEFFAQHKSHDLYESIDRVVEKILTQLDKHSW